MDGQRIAGGLLGIVALIAPVMTLAETTNYYTAPKIKVRGKASSAAAGAGTVVIKVFVKKTGAAGPFTIVKSTNHGDDAAAMDIAKNSTYAPATKGAVTQDAFYDFTLKFTGKGVYNSDSGGAPGSGIAAYKLMNSGGNYSGAKAGLESYLQGHPGDPEAEIQLGIANYYLNQPSDAAAAFDKGGNIPSNYSAVAVHAYTDAANAAYAAKDYPTAVGYAKRALAIAPGPFQYNTLGTVENAAGQSDAALADLEKARSGAASDDTIKPVEKAKIDVNLVDAYLAAGKPDQAKPILDEIAKYDPSNVNGKLFFAQYYAKQAQAANTAGKFADAAAAYEQAAALIGTGQQAVILYSQASQAYLKITPNSATPFDKAKADADKALALAPNDPGVLFLEGVISADQGKNPDALAYLKKADDAAKAGNLPDLTQRIEATMKQLNGGK